MLGCFPLRAFGGEGSGMEMQVGFAFRAPGWCFGAVLHQARVLQDWILGRIGLESRA